MRIRSGALFGGEGGFVKAHNQAFSYPKQVTKSLLVRHHAWICLILAGRQSGASKREMIGTVWIILGFAACACIMVGLAVRNRLLKKKVTVAPHDDQTKKGKQYAEMDVHNDSAQEPKETVIIEDPGAVADDLVMCKSKQADIFVEKVA